MKRSLYCLINKFTSLLVCDYNLQQQVPLLSFLVSQTACLRFFWAWPDFKHIKAYSFKFEHLASGFLMLVYECDVALYLYCTVDDKLSNKVSYQ